MTRLEGFSELVAQFVRLASTDGAVELFDEMAQLSQDYLVGGPSFERFTSNNVPSYLWSNQPGTREFDLLLTGHLDVVGAQTQKAFLPRIENGRIYGRGTADMKGSCAAMLVAFKRLLESEHLPLRLGLLFTCDEEVGGSNGARFLCEEVGIRSKVVFLPDGGSWGTLCVLQKGILQLELTTRGVPAHGARPWLGVSALDLILSDLEQIKQTLLTSEELNEWGISVNVGRLVAGEATNSVPAAATANVDIRFGEESSLNELRERLARLTLHAEVRELMASEVVTVSEESETLQLFQNVMRDAGLPATTMKEHGGSDACFYAKVSGTVLMTLPLCSKFHIEDEWADLLSLEKLSQLIVSFAKRLSEQ